MVDNKSRDIFCHTVTDLGRLGPWAKCVLLLAGLCGFLWVTTHLWAVAPWLPGINSLTYFSHIIVHGLSEIFQIMLNKCTYIFLDQKKVQVTHGEGREREHSSATAYVVPGTLKYAPWEEKWDCCQGFHKESFQQWYFPTLISLWSNTQLLGQRPPLSTEWPGSLYHLFNV